MEVDICDIWIYVFRYIICATGLMGKWEQVGDGEWQEHRGYCRAGQRPSPQEERQALMQIFAVAKRRYYNFCVRHVMPLGPKRLFPIDLNWERDIRNSADNFF